MRKLEPGEVFALFVLAFLGIGLAQSEIVVIYDNVVNWIATSNNPKWYVRVFYHVAVAAYAVFALQMMMSLYHYIKNKYKS